MKRWILPFLLLLILPAIARADFGVDTVGDPASVDTVTNIASVDGVEATQWFEDWGRKVVITIDGDYTTNLCSSGTLSNFPILLTENTVPAEMLDTDLSYNCDTGCVDLRAYAGDYSSSNPATENTNRLAIEIVEVTKAASGYTFEAYVEVPTVNCTSDTYFTLYYNATGKSQPAADATYGSEDVWNGTTGTSDDFIGVFHLNDSTTPINDSTEYDNDLDHAAGSPSYQSGGAKYGKYTILLVPNECLYKDDYSSVSTHPITHEAWYKISTLPGGSNHTVMAISEWAASPVSNTNLDIAQATNYRTYAYHSGATTNTLEGHASACSAGVWYYVAGRYSQASLYALRNGTSSSEDTTDVGVMSNLDNMTIGCRRMYSPTPDGYADGYFEEVRFSRANRSQNWILASYNHMNAPDTYIVEGTPGTP